jgi:YD repeat-containing protein
MEENKMKKFYRIIACLLSFVLCISLVPREVIALGATSRGSTQGNGSQEIPFTSLMIRSDEDYEALKEAWGSIAPLAEECDRYSLLSDEEKDKILALYGITESVMEELEELGFSLATSSQYARVMNTYDLNIEEVVYAADMFGDVNLLAVELRRFGEFIEKTELSQEMIDHVYAMILEGHEYVKAVRSYVAAQIMQVDVETASASSSSIQRTAVERELLTDQQETLLGEETLWFGEDDQQISETAADENVAALSGFYAIEPEILQEYLDETAIEEGALEELVRDAILDLYIEEEELEENASLLQNQMSSASMATYSAMSDTEDEEDVVVAPFTYQRTEQESVNLNTGDYTYEETDLVLPGKNGLDLVLRRRYDSSDASTELPLGAIDNPNAIVYTLEYAYYLQSADPNDMNCYESDRIPTTQYSRYTWGYADLATDSNPVILHESAMVSGVGAPDDDVYQDDGCWYYWDDFIIRNMSIQFRLKDRNYMMQCIDQYITPIAFTSTDTVTGDLITILAQPEIKVNPTALSSAAYSGSYKIANAYSQNRYGLGMGWSYAFSSIDEYFDTTYMSTSDENERHLVLTLADGRKFRVNFENGDTAEIEGYFNTDIVLTTQNQGASNQTYILKCADGRTETLNKAGFITQIKDRYNNSINFSYEYEASTYGYLNRAKKMTITDTLGRVVTLEDFQNNSSKRILTAPDGTTKEFTLLSSNTGGAHKYLSEVKDENDCVTKYTTNSFWGEYNTYCPYPTELSGTIWWRCLKAVRYTTNVEGEESWSLRFDIQSASSSVSHIFNGTGYQEFPKLSRRYVYVNDRGDKRTNMTEYSYESDPTAYGHTYLWLSQGTTKYTTTTSDWYYWHYKPVDSIITKIYQYYYGEAKYEFDTSNRMKKETTYTGFTDEAPYMFADLAHIYTRNPDIKIQERAYTYGLTEQPTSIVEKTYNYSGGSDYLERTYQYAYDWKGNITKYTDPGGYVTDYTYDTSTGNYNMPLTKIYKRDANTTIKEQYILTSDKKNISTYGVYENNSQKQKTIYTYDGYGNITKERRYRDGLSTYYDTDFSYTDNQSRTNFNGAYMTQRTVSGVLNSAGAYASATPGQASGSIVEKTYYDLMGRVEKTVDPNGQATEYEYDLKGNVSTITYPDQSVVSYEKDYDNNDLITTDANGTQMKYVYDPVGKLEYVQDVESEQILSTYAYDLYDNLREEINYSSEDTWTRTEYGVDRQGRPIRKEIYDEEENLLYHESIAYQDAYKESGVAYTKVTKTIHGASGAPDVVTTEYTDKMGNIVKNGYFLNGTEYKDTYTYDYLGNRLLSLTALDASCLERDRVTWRWPTRLAV